jgi:hypothetical protein
MFGTTESVTAAQLPLTSLEDDIAVTRIVNKEMAREGELY